MRSLRVENEDYYPGNHFVMHSACLLIIKRWMYEEGKTIQDLYNALCVYEPAGFSRRVLAKSTLWRRTLLGAILGSQAGLGGLCCNATLTI